MMNNRKRDELFIAAICDADFVKQNLFGDFYVRSTTIGHVIDIYEGLEGHVE